MTKFIIKVEIPDLLITELDKIPFRSGKSKRYAIKLIAVVLYALEEEEADSSSYYKPLSYGYIRDKITTHPFYKDYFLPYLQGQESDSNFNQRIFQTNGSYCKGFFPLHYRINPEFLSGPGKEHEIEIEFETLNDLFPEVLLHFEKSVALVKPMILREEMNRLINERSLQIGLIANGARSAYFSRSTEDTVSFTGKTTEMPDTIRLEKENNSAFAKSEIEGLIEKRKKESGKANIILIQEKNKKNKNKFQVAEIEEFLMEKRSRFLKRVHRNIDRILAGEWTPSISESNGRFNHRFTFADKFCIDFFSLDGEAIASLDLKSSQPTILANILVQNHRLLTSIKKSRIKELVLFLEKNESVFFSIVDDGWLNLFMEADIYQVIADEKEYYKGEAKKKMMELLFTEPNVPSSIAESLAKHFPEFLTGLKKTKKSFKKTAGSSKRKLPLFLQLLEAHIFIEVVYPEIAKAGIPAISKHDCIMFPKSREKEVKEIIDSCFEKLGFKGKVVLDEKKDLHINEFPEGYKPSGEPG
jgi:hypothetical protein